MVADSGKAIPILMVVVGLVGIIVNGFSLFILMCSRRNRASNQFHTLLKILAVSDLVVVVGCALLYGLPEVITVYRQDYCLYV